MTRAVALLVVIAAAPGVEAPKPLSRAPGALPEQPRGKCVLDEAHSVDPASFATLERLCEELDHSGAGQLEVAVVADLRGMSADEFATALFDKWRIGHQSADDGLLVVRHAGAPGARHLVVRTGFGLQEALPDNDVGALMDATFLPHIDEGDGPALVALVKALAPLVEKAGKTARVRSGDASRAARAGRQKR